MTEMVQTESQVWQLPDGRFATVRILEQRNGLVTLLVESGRLPVGLGVR
jgi:hypothetical protein